MVQTRRTLEGLQASRSHQAGGNGSTRVQHLGDDPTPAATLPRVGVDNNYDDVMAREESQDKNTKPRLENQALQLLLRKQLNKYISVQAEDGDEVSSIGGSDLPTGSRFHRSPSPDPFRGSKRKASRGEGEMHPHRHARRPDHPPKTKCFRTANREGLWAKVWAKSELRRLINSTVAGKAIPHTPRDLARKSLGKQNGSPFT